LAEGSGELQSSAVAAGVGSDAERSGEETAVGMTEFLLLGELPEQHEFSGQAVVARELA
jgi:hypothetical protein